MPRNSEQENSDEVDGGNEQEAGDETANDDNAQPILADDLANQSQDEDNG